MPKKRKCINYFNNSNNSNDIDIYELQSGGEYKKKPQLYKSEKYNTDLKKLHTVDLKINGKIFPVWILNKYKQYALDPVKINKNIDPCIVKDKEESKKYQKFVAQYLDFTSQQRSLLLYHSLGSGKSKTSILVMTTLYKHTSDWNVFILIKASLRDTWLSELQKWLSEEDYNNQFKNIKFIHYDSPFADRDFNTAMKESDISKKNIYIIDEAHNFIRNVYSNINSKAGKRAQNIYDYMMRDAKENITTRLILISGTPIINSNYELVLIFNLLRPGCFPKSESEFNKIFVSHSSLNPSKKNLFQRRILGLVSYYFGSTPDLFATKSISYVDLEMSEYHEMTYGFFENIETKAGKNKAKFQSRSVIDIYRPLTRPASNFVFPTVDSKITGDTKPTPSRFRLSERDAAAIEIGQQNKLKAEKNTDKFLNINAYLNEIKYFMKKTEEYFDNINNEDIQNNHSIIRDYEIYKTKYNNKFRKWMKKEEVKSRLFHILNDCSPKYMYSIFKILDTEGTAVTYSNYVRMEGLEMYKIYLKYFDFTNYSENKNSSTDKQSKYKFAEYSGIINKENRALHRKTFNKVENKNGSIIKLLLISPSGTEGINLANVRQIHILEPYWNNVRIEQVIGRTIRQCSHKDLPLEKRHVDIFKYKCIRKNGKKTTDQHIENIARRKEASNQTFLDAAIEAAVDCGLFKAHNMLINEYKCFQFNQDDLFKKYIGPAYIEDIYDDMKFDSGSNSLTSITKSIRVRQVNAVIDTGTNSKNQVDNNKYSKSEKYLLHDDSKIIYDLNLHYPIGKIKTDANNIPVKFDKDNYIIDDLIIKQFS